MLFAYIEIDVYFKWMNFVGVNTLDSISSDAV